MDSAPIVRMPNSDQNGWALVSVLWLLAGLALMASAVQLLTLTSYRMEKHALDAAHAGAILDAGVTHAVVCIGAPRTGDRCPIDGRPFQFQFQGVAMEISVQDERGRFDINEIDESILDQILLS